MADHPVLAFGLAKGQIISSRELMERFKCACEGGIRYSSKTGTVVVVVNNSLGEWPCQWRDDILEYIGQGRKGDQQMTRMNKRLAEFMAEKKPIYVFEADKPGQYKFIGSARAHAMPWQREMDSEGQSRKVWIFPLEIIQ